jgi:hypothetical protein
MESELYTMSSRANHHEPGYSIPLPYASLLYSGADCLYGANHDETSHLSSTSWQDLSVLIFFCYQRKGSRVIHPLQVFRP